MTDSPAPHFEINSTDSSNSNRTEEIASEVLSDGGSSPSLPVSDYRICCPGLPLAVYREVTAHLRQVDGVNSGLIPQTSQEFSYGMSQIGGLWLTYETDVDDGSQQRVEEILAYYSDRFGAWEVFK